MKTLLYYYEANLLKIVDGDTLTLSIDLGFKTYRTMNCRMVHINAEELNSLNEEKRNSANKAKEWLINNLKVGDTFLIKSTSVDKYGRPLVEIWKYNKSKKEPVDNSINEQLLSLGLVNPY